MFNKTSKKNFSNFGEGLQIYDVLFEVSKLDSFQKTDGKSSEKYKRQHEKTVKLVSQFNNEPMARNGLSLSKSRAIIQGQRSQEGVAFYNDGKKVAGNKGEE